MHWQTLLYIFYYICLFWMCIHVGAHKPCTRVWPNGLNSWGCQDECKYPYSTNHIISTATVILQNYSIKLENSGESKVVEASFGVMWNLLVERASVSEHLDPQKPSPKWFFSERASEQRKPLLGVLLFPALLHQLASTESNLALRICKLRVAE